MTNKRGWHNSFWNHSTDTTNEIDAFEIDSDKPEELKSNLHYWKHGNTIWAGGSKTHIMANPLDWHVVGFEWTPAGVSVWLDSTLIRQAAYPGPHSPGEVFFTGSA